MFVTLRFTTLGVFCGLLDFGPNLRSKLRGRAAQQMALGGSLSKNVTTSPKRAVTGEGTKHGV